MIEGLDSTLKCPQTLDFLQPSSSAACGGGRSKAVAAATALQGGLRKNLKRQRRLGVRPQSFCLAPSDTNGAGCAGVTSNS
jgi:hypothetical protein